MSYCRRPGNWKEIALCPGTCWATAADGGRGVNEKEVEVEAKAEEGSAGGGGNCV